MCCLFPLRPCIACPLVTHLVPNPSNFVGQFSVCVCAQVEFLHETCHKSKWAVRLLHSNLAPPPQFPALAHNSLPLLIACSLAHCCCKLCSPHTCYDSASERAAKPSSESRLTRHVHVHRRNVAVTCDLSRESLAPCQLKQPTFSFPRNANTHSHLGLPGAVGLPIS